MVVLWPLLLLSPFSLPGIALAIFLLLAAELCEAGYLYKQRSRLLDVHGLVPVGSREIQ
ncbi:MAG: hypothetical protein GWO30_03460 [Gammaproteobacteria bacterium]|nr:hypothetical protein [Gammaproteobacteria bacterium]NIQ11584.1 hypothetical protein [Gammaproteobacteria bacterium]NIR51920.1 hypothetical protein [candidate division KSB1 bacterium]NIS27269.1 hypothetical protein [candidate division KSB1 bacterium]NIY19538.1 hypothetical protein [Gammaproteobacteria bacterium]